MRTIVFIFTLLLVSSIGYFTYAHFSGGKLPTFGLPLGGERADIRTRAQQFFEHVKFKNTSALKNFVSDNTSNSELSDYLVKVLGMSADDLDLVMTSVEHVEIDSTTTRARVRIRLTGQNLIDKKPFDTSKIIFLYKNSANDWLIDTGNLAQ